MNSTDLLTVAASLSAVAYLVAAVLAALRLKAAPAATSLVVYGLVASLWSVLQLAFLNVWLPGLSQALLLRLPLYGLALLALLFYLCIQSLAHRRLPAAVWALAGVWLLALVVLEVGWQAPWGPGSSIGLERLLLALTILGWGLWLGLAASAARGVLSSTPDPVLRNRMKYLALVFPLLLTGDVLFFAAYWPAGGLVRLSGVVVLWLAVLSPRLPAARQVTRRLAADLLIVALAAVVYAVILQSAALVMNQRLDASVWPVILAAGLLAALLQPGQARLQEWLRRRVAGARRDRNRLLRRYSQRISNILEVPVLAATVTEMLARFFDARQAYLYVVDQEKGAEGKNFYRLRRIQPEGEARTAPGLLPEDGLVANRLHQERQTLSMTELYQTERYAALTSPEKAWFQLQDMEIFVPVLARDGWIGLLGLAAKNSGESYLDDDRELLAILAAQTAVALENARLVEGLLRLNSEFRRTYAALDQANRHLERLDRTKTDFISIASHELRTPLTVLAGYSQMLSEDPQLTGDPRYKKSLEGIQNGAQRLHEIVDSMLDMARIDLQDFRLDLQPVSIAAVIESLANELEPALSERRQTIEMHELALLPGIEAEPEAVHKIFYHLLVNAIKYTPDGGRIKISGQPLLPSPVDLPQGGVEVVIADTGVGIDPRLHELIFTKFYQTGELALHSSGKTKFKGSGPGLGLAIVRGFVNAHSGKVWVESPGHDELRCPGSSFHVILPLQQPPEKRIRRRENPLLGVA